MAVLLNITKTVAIPHEEGQTLTIKRLTPKQLRRAAEAYTDASLATFRRMGGAQFMAELKAMGDTGDEKSGKVLALGFDESVRRVTEALKREGFGIITEIDVKATLKHKINVEFRPYRILGACNPALAYEALQLEDKVGTMLPCNVVVQELAPGRVEVAAVDPVASMMAIDNPLLLEKAALVRAKLEGAIASL